MALGGLTLPIEKKKEEKVGPIFSAKDMEAFMEGGKVVNSTICALIVGPPKSCKTGICLDSISKEELEKGMKVVYLEFNHDHGGRINKKIFHSDHPGIIVLDPTETSADENGDEVVDYIRTMTKIKVFLKYLKDNKDKLNLKAIVVDGADRFLSEICERQMRLDENIDVTGGVSLKYWMVRNRYFHDVMDRLLEIDVDKYIISHPKEDKDTGKISYGVQKDFPDRVHQIVETRYDVKTNKYYAKIVADRRDNPNLNKDILIMEVVDGRKIWYGLKL